jgi:hypothetical protein
MGLDLLKAMMNRWNARASAKMVRADADWRKGGASVNQQILPAHPMGSSSFRHSFPG